ncbi:malolactic enzyme [Loigolactobacillus jiayinensis]|uniref:Malolactic enzyme n=1 Tax=Loigolactobacillus jiayinensis TaxID=2486016 RepID=A0ABW1RGZ3_9LACO|nr:malolactic enzyme [Loigolactobacillus jiayinensis]
MNAQAILQDPLRNKGTAFTVAERRELGLTGLLPPQVQTLEEQVAQVYEQLQHRSSALDKHLFLMQIFNQNRVLFYRLLRQYLVELLPLVYTPTIGDAVEQYGQHFIEPGGAVYLSINDPDSMAASLKAAAAGREIKMVVVTDGEGVLGIGDWGVNGVDISIGKLMVYTAAAGIDPRQVLPIVLDVGTNNQQLLADPQYLGNRQQRVRGKAYHEFIDRFATVVEATFPHVFLHWEDFGRENAAAILNQYQDQITTFNDDIQGTGIVVLAGILGALSISGERLTDQRYLCFGAGTAGTGVARRIFLEMQAQGLSAAEARQHFYLVDRQGLLFDDMTDLTPEQQPFARQRSEFSNAAALTNLTAVVAAVQPTILVGTSGQPGSFTEEIVTTMAAHTPRPIIFAMSNPTKLSEAKAVDLINWSAGQALVATGVPQDPVTYKGVTYEIGQANNALVYPGLGLGVIAAQATRLNDEMISQAAHSLGGIVDTSQPGAAVLPPVAKVTEYQKTIAIAVVQSALEQNLAGREITDVAAVVAENQWLPEY